MGASQFLGGKRWKARLRGGVSLTVFDFCGPIQNGG
jgi:hypothetical protein